MKRISALRVHARSSRDERARETSKGPAVIVVPPLSTERHGNEEEGAGKELPEAETALVRLITSPRKPYSMVGIG